MSDKVNLKDFSMEAMKKAVLDASLTHPLFLGSMCVCFFGILGVVLFSAPMVAIVALVVGFLVGGGAFSVNFFGRRADLESEYISKLNKRAEARTLKKLEDLNKDIEDCLEFSGNDELVVQAQKQFEIINAKFDSFKEILIKKFDPSELTYGRFYTTAEQTHGAVLDNIEKIVLNFKALKDIDKGYLEERFDKLEGYIKAGTAEEFDKEEFKAIEARLDLREDKLYEIDSVLSNNEKAMTELSSINFKLSDLKTHEGRASQDLEKTLSELTNLAKSASKYEM